MTERKTDPAQLLKDAGLDWPPELVQAWVEADKAMQEMVGLLPHDLPYPVEPAHVFHPTPKARP
jgi:hypothetical protein